MDQNESTVFLTISNSRPISPSLVTETTVAEPATVEEGTKGKEKKRDWPKIYGRDAKGKFLSKDETQTKRSSLRKSIGDMSMTIGGRDFRPHIFTINKGEDIIRNIMYFTDNGSRGINILSVNGAVANVKIQPLSKPRRVVTFKEAYEIVSLSNTMTISESGGVNIKTGDWRITIGGAGGSIFSGALAGILIAASPVQVVVGSFWPLVTNPPQKVKVVASTGQVQQPDMVGPSLSQKKNDGSKALIVAPTIPPSALASSSTGQVQQPDIGSLSQYQKRNAESKDVIASPTIPSTLGFSLTVQVQHPNMIVPYHSQNRDDESQAVVIPPTKPKALASSSTGNIQEPEMEGPFLTLGWYGSETEHKK